MSLLYICTQNYMMNVEMTYGTGRPDARRPGRTMHPAIPNIRYASLITESIMFLQAGMNNGLQAVQERRRPL